MKTTAVEVSQETIEAFQRLNGDMTIGPNAPGDGDFIQWHVVAVYIVASEFGRSHPPPDRAFSYSFTHLEREQGETVGNWFRRDMRASADAFIAAIYGTLTENEARDWSMLCHALLEREISTQWGGRKIRVPMRRKQVDPQAQIEAALSSGMSLPDAFAKAGVSRATGYRILNKKSKNGNRLKLP